MYDSLRMQSVQTPIIPVVGELIRANPGTISLGQGVAYYGPPPEAGRYIEKFFADPQNHKYKLVQGIPELLEAIEKQARRGERHSRRARPADRRHRRGEHGLCQRGPGHHRPRRRDHSEPALLLQPRDGDHDGRLQGRLRADGRELPIAAGPHREGDHESHAGCRHDLSQQPKRRRLLGERSAAGQRPLPPATASITSPTRPTSTSSTTTPDTSRPAPSQAARSTRSPCTRCPKPTASQAGESAGWSSPSGCSRPFARSRTRS